MTVPAGSDGSLRRVRHQWMDGLRGLAVVAVVLFHAELAGGPLPWLSELNLALEPYRMPLLMVLSGLLLERSLAKGARRHVDGKVRLILWPYLVWATLDMVNVVAHRLAAGEPVESIPVGWLVHNPSSYLWFLSYLFCFHLLATPLPDWARTPLGPVLLVLASGVPETHTLHRFVDLAGWFLVGDGLARVVGPRVPQAVVHLAARPRWGVLAAIGRQSIVYYACHLLVMVYAVQLTRDLGVTDPPLVVGVAVVVPLGVGALLVHLRRHRWAGILFAWPRVDSAAVTEPRFAAPEVAHVRT